MRPAPGSTVSREQRKAVESPNQLEHVNRETGPRSDVVGPNDAALTHLAGGLLIEQNDE
jgi:hypothetical protein